MQTALETLRAMGPTRRSGQSGEDLLVAWLASRDIYARWHGGNGTTRAALVWPVVLELGSRGLVPHTARDVRAKISELEENMRNAIAWRETQASPLVRRRGGTTVSASVRAELLRRCAYYETLAPVMEPLLRNEPDLTPPPSTPKVLKPTPIKKTSVKAAVRFAPTARPPVTSRVRAPVRSSPTVESEPLGFEPHRESPPRRTARKKPTVRSIVPVSASVVARVTSEEPPRPDPRANNTSEDVAIPSVPSPPSSAIDPVPVPPDELNLIPPAVTDPVPAPPVQIVNQADPRPQNQATRVGTSTDDTWGATSGANPALDALLRQVEIDRLQYEQRSYARREEQLQLDVARQQIQVTKEKALARHELRLAGVPEHEIDAVFPLGGRSGETTHMGSWS